MKDVVIVSAKRTAVGTYGGSLKSLSAVDMASQVVKASLEDLKLDPKEVDEVILGNVLGAGLGQNVARQVLIKSGIPQESQAFTLNKVCGSGLKAVALAAQSIMIGDNDLVIAGGTESMSQAPYVLDQHRWGARMGDSTVLDTMLKDGLTDAFHDYHMGITAENIAEKYGFSRQDQDQLALMSQERAVAARESGRFKDEIVPLSIPQRKGDPIIFDQDEYPRPGVSLESLGNLKSAFKKDGTVTAGNASGINDGAAILVVMSKDKADQLGLEPLVTIKAAASAGVDPAFMGTGPIPATKKALAKADLAIEDLDLIEANEAFASQALSVIKDLDLNTDIVNVNGGAIAIGHPIGASGARILVTLVHEMVKRDAKRGLATLCIGGGQGIAMVVTR